MWRPGFSAPGGEEKKGRETAPPLPQGERETFEKKAFPPGNFRQGRPSLRPLDRPLP